jgi:hypothetical protein
MRRADGGRGLRAIPAMTSILGPWFVRVTGAGGQPTEETPLSRVLRRVRSRRMSAGLAGALTGVPVLVLALFEPPAAAVVAAAAGLAALTLALVRWRRRAAGDAAVEADGRYRTLLDATKERDSDFRSAASAGLMLLPVCAST